MTEAQKARSKKFQALAAAAAQNALAKGAAK